MKARVLLVEDNPIDETLIRRVAQRAHADVDLVVAHTFSDAVSAAASSDTFDLVLADYFLPGADTGVDVAREVRIPTAVMTGTTREQIREQAQRAGAIACLSKEDLLKDGALDDLIRLAQTANNPQPTLLETSQKKQIEEQKRYIADLEASRGGVIGVLLWVSKNKILTVGVLCLLLLAAIFAIVLGGWPG